MESRVSVYVIAVGVGHHKGAFFCGLIPYDCFAINSIPQQGADSIHGFAVIKNVWVQIHRLKSQNVFFLRLFFGIDNEERRDLRVGAVLREQNALPSIGKFLRFVCGKGRHW